MYKFFDPYFDILMNWANRFEKPQKSLSKFYLSEDSEDFWKAKLVFYQALNAFFYTGNLFHPAC